MNKEDNSDNKNRNYWKEEEENLLRQWADKAQCYQWMHSRSHNIYSRRNAFFTIPVIIISTITGTANFAQERFPDQYKNYIVISIGTLSIIAGIITTIYQFLKIAEMNEGHRVSSLSWGKFFRNIKTEMTRHPLDRMSPIEFIKISKDEYDRLIELSPIISTNIINEFNKKFVNNTELYKPEICNELLPTNVFKMDNKERLALYNKINNIKKPVVSKEEIQKKSLINKKINEKNEKFRETFHSLNGRYPTPSEIKKNMEKYINDTEDILSQSSIENIMSTINETSFSNSNNDSINNTNNSINSDDILIKESIENKSDNEFLNFVQDKNSSVEIDLENNQKPDSESIV